MKWPMIHRILFVFLLFVCPFMLADAQTQGVLRIVESPWPFAPNVAPDPAPVSISVSFAQQPLETMRAVLQAKPKGIALYTVEMCSLDSGSVMFDSAHVRQAAVARFQPIDESLALATLRAGQARSWRYQTVAALHKVGSLSAVLLVSKALHASDGITLGVTVGVALASELRDLLRAEIPDMTAFHSVFLKGPMALPPFGCQTRLLLGSYEKDAKFFVTTIHVPR